jgi:hypothetical protein
MSQEKSQSRLKIIRALLWCEWRQTRRAAAMLICLYAAIWAALAAIKFSGRISRDDLEILLAPAVFIAPFAPQFVFCRSFDIEIQKGTIVFQRGLPVKFSTIYWVKYFFSLGMSIAFGLLGFALFFILAAYEPSETLDSAFAGGSNSFPLIPILISLWLCAHINGFGVPLITRNKRDLDATLLMIISTLPFIVVLPVSLPIPGGICGGMCAGLGALFIITLFFVFFWERIWFHYISRGLAARRPVLITCAVLAAAAALIWSGGWLYERARLELALREARRAGLETNMRQAKSYPGEKNAADIIQAFIKKSELLPNRERYIEDRNSKFCLHCLSGEDADTLLKNPLAPELSEMLSEASKLHFYLPEDFDRTSLFRIAYDKIMSAVSFLACRAVVLRLESKNAAAREELDKAFLTAKILHWDSTSRLAYMRAINIIAQAALAGSRDPSGTEHWMNLLRECLAPPNPFAGDTPAYELRLWRENKFSAIDWAYNDFAPVKSLWFRSVAVPRILAEAAAWLRCNNARAALADEITATGRLSSDTAAAKRHSAAWPACVNISKDEDFDFNCYVAVRNILNIRTLELALNIYRARHGVFPEKLDDLVTDILPVMPMDIQNSNIKFSYERKNDGFILSSPSKSVLYSLGCPKCHPEKFAPYEKKTKSGGEERHD